MMWKRNSNIMMSMLRLKAAGDTYLTNKRINLLDKILLLLQKNPSDILAVSEVIQIKLYRSIVK